MAAVSQYLDALHEQPAGSRFPDGHFPDRRTIDPGIPGQGGLGDGTDLLGEEIDED